MQYCSTCEIRICNSALGLLQTVECEWPLNISNIFFTSNIFSLSNIFYSSNVWKYFIPTCPSLNPWCGGGVCPSCRSWSRGRAASSASPAACPASADSLSGLKNIYQVSENYLKLFLLIIIFYFEEMLRSRQPRLSHKVLSWGLSEVFIANEN